MTPPTLAPAELDAIATFFDGDRALYLSFRAACVAQFQADMQAGDRWSAEGDLDALRRLVHSLKSVLQTLGHAELSSLAKEAEQAAKAQDLRAAQRGWQQVRDGLVHGFQLGT